MDISERLKYIEEVREETDFKNYQERLKNNLDDLINESKNITYHGQIEFWEKVEGFEKYLPRLQLNQESKEKSIRLIKNIEEYYRRKIEGLKESIEEKKGEIEEAEKEISSIRTEINQYRNLEDIIKSK